MNNILITGGPGTGKTFLSRALAYYVGLGGMNLDDAFNQDATSDYTLIENYIASDFVEYIQVHASMTYEDIVYGIDVDMSGTPTMFYAEKRIKKICDRAVTNTGRYFVILDDIERTNASALLGNLLYAMEYRNEPVTLCDGTTLIVPDNVFFVITECKNMYGTPLEYALRRRFDYEKELYSSEKVLEDYYNSILSSANVRVVLDVFESVQNYIYLHMNLDVLSQKEKYLPGHGMYMVSNTGTDAVILRKVEEKFIYQIYPYIENMAREGIILTTDADLALLKNRITGQLNAGILTPVAAGNVNKVLINSHNVITTFSLSDSKNYYVNTIIPNGCKEHRGIIENICDAILKNGILPIDKAMFDVLLNTNVVRFTNRNPARIGAYAAFLVEATQNDDYGYLTTVSAHTRSYYSSNACRTGRWSRYNDAPAYDVTYSDGTTVEYISLNAFRNAGFDTASPVIHAKENTASIYCALFRLIKAYLDVCETEFHMLSLVDADYADIYELVKLENEYWDFVNLNAQDQRGVDNKLICLATAALNINILWNAVGTNITVDLAKFDRLVSGATSNSVINYEGLYNITGASKNIEVKGVTRMVDLNDYQKIMENIGVHQMIFQGPPGTSKTFECKKFVLKQLHATSTVFATGTDVTQDLISSELEPYKLMASDYADPQHSPKLATGGWDIVQFHPSYGYEDFIRGIEVKPLAGVPTYETINRILGKIAEFAKIAENAVAQGNPVPNFYLIVDEINRANLATVFGELIYGLEYRDSKVSTPYEVQDRSIGGRTNDIILGKNLFIIGTMNTADKSIDSIDYAIRRRFIFVDSPAKREIVLSRYQTVMGAAPTDENSIELLLFDAVGTLFDGDRFFNEEYQRRDVRIGHTYFLRKRAANYLDDMIEKFIFQIIPILREYQKDGILDSYEDLKAMEHDAVQLAAATPQDRITMLGENIMLYIKCFGEMNGAGVEKIDNQYIADAIENLSTRLGY